MRYLKATFTAVLLYSFTTIAWSQPAENELPLGVYLQSSHTFGYGTAQMDSMHDMLGKLAIIDFWDSLGPPNGLRASFFHKFYGIFHISNRITS